MSAVEMNDVAEVGAAKMIATEVSAASARENEIVIRE